MKTKQNIKRENANQSKTKQNKSREEKNNLECSSSFDRWSKCRRMQETNEELTERNWKEKKNCCQHPTHIKLKFIIII